MMMRSNVRLKLRAKKRTSVYCRLANRLYYTCPLKENPSSCPFAQECTGLSEKTLKQRS